MISCCNSIARLSRTPNADIPLGADEETILNALRPAEAPHNIPIGTIDGVPVLGSYMENGKLYCVKVEWQGKEISTDGDTYLNLGLEGDCGCVGDMPLYEWETNKALARVGIVEQLIALAQQHRYYAQPADEPENTDLLIEILEYVCGAEDEPAVTARPHVCDDTQDARLGTVIWTDYRVGDGDGLAQCYVPAGRSENPHDVPTVYAFGMDGTELAQVMRALPNLIALLNDARVQQVYREWWPAA